MLPEGSAVKITCHSRINTARSLMFFLLAGVLAAALYFFIIAFMLEEMSVHYSIAVGVAYFLAASFQFFFNRKVSFNPGLSRVAWQISKYVVMICVNYSLTMILIRLITEYLAMNVYWGVILGLLLTTPTGYLMSRYWVYR